LGAHGNEHADSDSDAAPNIDADAHTHRPADSYAYEHAAAKLGAPDGNADADTHSQSDGGSDQHSAAWIGHANAGMGGYATADHRGADTYGDAFAAADHARLVTHAIGDPVAHDASVDAHAWAILDAGAQPDSVAHIACAKRQPDAVAHVSPAADGHSDANDYTDAV
jgi:hypothetical protein